MTKQKLWAVNKALEHLIEQRDEELRAAMNQAVTATENEAGRIGALIHDELCQDLIALSRLAETAHVQHETQCAACVDKFSRIRRQALYLTDMARTYSHELARHDCP